MSSRLLGLLFLLILLALPAHFVAPLVTGQARDTADLEDPRSNLDRGARVFGRGATVPVPQLRVAILALAQDGTASAILSTQDVLLRDRGGARLDLSFRSASAGPMRGLSLQNPPAARIGWPLPPEFGGPHFDLGGEVHWFGSHQGLHLIASRGLGGTAGTVAPGSWSSSSADVHLGGIALRPGVPVARVDPLVGLAVFLMLLDPLNEAGDVVPTLREEWRAAFADVAESDRHPSRAEIDAAVDALAPRIRDDELRSVHFGAFAPVLDAATAAFALHDVELLDRCGRRSSTFPSFVETTFAEGVSLGDGLSSPWWNARTAERAWVASLLTFLGVIPYGDAGGRELGDLGFDLAWPWDGWMTESSWVCAPRILAYSTDPALIEAARETGVDRTGESPGLVLFATATPELGRDDEARAAWKDVRESAIRHLSFPWNLVAARSATVVAWLALPLVAGALCLLGIRRDPTLPFLTRLRMILLLLACVVQVNGFPLRVFLLPVWLVLGRRWLGATERRTWWSPLLVGALLAVVSVDALAAFGAYSTDGWAVSLQGMGVPLGLLLVGAIVSEDARWTRLELLPRALAVLSVSGLIGVAWPRGGGSIALFGLVLCLAVAWRGPRRSQHEADG